MHPVAILLVGVGLVLAGILVLRLHAFLALLLAAFAVAVLTPRDAAGRLRRRAGGRRRLDGRPRRRSSPARRPPTGSPRGSASTAAEHRHPDRPGGHHRQVPARQRRRRPDRPLRPCAWSARDARRLAFLASGFVLGDPGVLRHRVLSDDAAGQGPLAAHPTRLRAVCAVDRRRRHDGALAGAADAGAAVRGRRAGGRPADDDRRRLRRRARSPRWPATLSPRGSTAGMEVPLRDSADARLDDLEALSKRADQRPAPAVARRCCRSRCRCS